MPMSKIYDLLEINTDGGSRGNPGQAAIGVIAKAEGQVIYTLSEKIGETTNNVAEYTAVLRALEEIESQDIFTEKIRFILDSELIVKQITGLYKVKQPHLQELRKTIIDLIKKLRDTGQIKLMSFVNVLRDKNEEADQLVNNALDK
ncbi:MAG: Ribonuclease HI [Candidatus Collierbacteria bacterium GW2011_GWC2_44_18]|uniref:Ribonuclease HI n=2 Tax=Microgenomates group TaxID=1794810 RepID=A0A0G1HPQ0_9BACT|nr:MAG: Ribonuclease HI [Microgenomates group bacterium GW2011_GWC1_44_10]KKT49136.1 MAG: Ribonuclease HI [Candidatus Collierbacteria bacterium GW2011_GWC2_44_18]